MNLGGKTFFAMLALAAAALWTAGCRPPPPSRELRLNPDSEPLPAQRYQRIVSLAPSLTQILLALGIEDRVVGITDFCALPADVGDIPRVGGYLDLNMERMVGLEPDLIVMLTVERTGLPRRLDRLGIDYLMVDNRTVSQIVESVVLIGNVVGASESAAALTAAMRESMERIRRLARSQPTQRVLVCVGRGLEGASGEIYVAGPGSIYDQLLTMAGGENAYRGRLDYATLGRENIIRLNPEVIIELVETNGSSSVSPDQIRRHWQALGQHVKAVRSDRVHMIVGDHVMVPGVRIHHLLEDFVRALHPDSPEQP